MRSRTSSLLDMNNTNCLSPINRTLGSSMQVDPSHIRILNVASSHFARNKTLLRILFRWSRETERSCNLRIHARETNRYRSSKIWFHKWKTTILRKILVRGVRFRLANRCRQQTLRRVMICFLSHCDLQYYRKHLSNSFRLKREHSLLSFWKIVSGWSAIAARAHAAESMQRKLSFRRSEKIAAAAIHGMRCSARRRRRIQRAARKALHSALARWRYAHRTKRVLRRRAQQAIARAACDDRRRVFAALEAWAASARSAGWGCGRPA